jgi:hypothetical protein
VEDGINEGFCVGADVSFNLLVKSVKFVKFETLEVLVRLVKLLKFDTTGAKVVGVEVVGEVVGARVP